MANGQNNRRACLGSPSGSLWPMVAFKQLQINNPKCSLWIIYVLLHSVLILYELFQGNIRCEICTWALCDPLQSAEQSKTRAQSYSKERSERASERKLWFSGSKVVSCTVHDANRCRFINVSLWTSRASLSTFVKVGFKNNEGRSHLITTNATTRKWRTAKSQNGST